MKFNFIIHYKGPLMTTIFLELYQSKDSKDFHVVDRSNLRIHSWYINVDT